LENIYVQCASFFVLNHKPLSGNDKIRKEERLTQHTIITPVVALARSFYHEFLLGTDQGL